jgi:hypothetical protein
MNTLAKIEANRRNGRLSTGPQTAEGKATVARNATKHGIFAAVPVIPGEDPGAWEAHRAGVVASLSPVGLLEVNLAERAALLLWRLQRLARYEAETITAAMEAVEVPALPPPPPVVPPIFSTPPQKTRDQQLRDLRHELRTARAELAEVGPARDYVQALPEAGADEPVPLAVAEIILETAWSRAETAEDLRSDPPAFGSKPFLRKLDLNGTEPGGVAWTAGLIRRGLEFYATYAREDPEQFQEAVGAELEERGEELARQARRLEGESAAVARLLDGGAARRRAAKQLPADGREERIAKYERHLHSLLTSTLHELERLQARREGEPVPPPVVADVNVTVEAAPE